MLNLHSNFNISTDRVNVIQLIWIINNMTKPKFIDKIKYYSIILKTLFNY